MRQLPRTGCPIHSSASWSDDLPTHSSHHVHRYSYRIAPADGPLNEATFNRMPLDFVGKQMLRWGGGTAKGGKQLSFNGTYATGDQVVPAGSMWAKIPIPLIQIGDGPLGYIGYPIAPGCAELWGNQSAAMCSGMGDGDSSVDDLEIVDRVLIPKGTPPGEYVLNWRYDCEESNQVWQSCADITIV